MPPKKTAAAKVPAVDENGEVKFSWTPENERRLLLLAARSSVSGPDYREFVKAMPPGVSYEGLRQKFQKLRKEQKEIYEKMGWTLSDSTPTSNGNGAEKTETPASANSGKKRSADGDAEGEDAPVKPAKKPRARKTTAAAEGADGEETPEKPVRKPRAKKQTAAEGAEGEEGAEKPTKKTAAKGKGRPKKGAKADEVQEDDCPTNDLGDEVNEEEEVVDEV